MNGSASASRRPRVAKTLDANVAAPRGTAGRSRSSPRRSFVDTGMTAGPGYPDAAAFMQRFAQAGRMATLAGPGLLDGLAHVHDHDHDHAPVWSNRRRLLALLGVPPEVTSSRSPR